MFLVDAFRFRFVFLFRSFACITLVVREESNTGYEGTIQKSQTHQREKEGYK